MSAPTLTIGGERVSTRSHQPVLDPATLATVGLMPLAETADLEHAVAAAKAAFPGWAATPDDVRAAACLAIAERIEANADELARLLTAEQGKPLGGLGSRFEIGGAAAWSRYTAALTLPVEVLSDDAQGRVELHRRPIGVVGSITPWNWPILIAVWHVLPAVRAGNTVVLKPSPLTPLGTIRLVELMNEVLPPGVVNVITGRDEIGAAMTAHPDIAKISFTGSTATGRKVMAAGAATLKRATLELGGNDAGIVLPDADPAAIAEGLFWGAFINSGQTCAALKRLYVPDTLHDAVVDALAGFAAGVKLGNGFEADSVLGPLQNERQFRIVTDFVAEARAAGGRAITAPGPEGGGWFHPEIGRAHV